MTKEQSRIEELKRRYNLRKAMGKSTHKITAVMEPLVNADLSRSEGRKPRYRVPAGKNRGGTNTHSTLERAENYAASHAQGGVKYLGKFERQ